MAKNQIGRGLVLFSLGNTDHRFVCHPLGHGYTPQMYKGDTKPDIPPCVMMTSTIRLNLGVIQFFADTRKSKPKENASTIFAPCAAF